jgi:hypothetical protein
MSLTPRSRLTSDSHRSPRGAASMASRPILAASPRLFHGARPNMPTTTMTTNSDMNMPPTRPSTVLLGLASEIGRVPIVRPISRPPTS